MNCDCNHYTIIKVRIYLLNANLYDVLKFVRIFYSSLANFIYYRRWAIDVEFNKKIYP